MVSWLRTRKTDTLLELILSLFNSPPEHKLMCKFLSSLFFSSQSDSTRSQEKKVEDKSKKCAMPLSQVPSLPHITPQYQMEQRPHSSPPSKLTGEQICQILSDAGKHRTQLLSSHCTTSSINR